MSSPNRSGREGRGDRPGFLPEDERALRDLRSVLLRHHKVLMDLTQRGWERTHGRVAGPGELLNLVMADPGFRWLRLLSSKIARLDGTLDDPEEGAAEELVLEVDRLLLDREPEEVEFQLQYQAAITDSADASLLHVKVAHALRQVKGRPLPLSKPR